MSDHCSLFFDLRPFRLPVRFSRISFSCEKKIAASRRFIYTFEKIALRVFYSNFKKTVCQFPTGEHFLVSGRKFSIFPLKKSKEIYNLRLKFPQNPSTTAKTSKFPARSEARSDIIFQQ